MICFNKNIHLDITEGIFIIFELYSIVFSIFQMIRYFIKVPEMLIIVLFKSLRIVKDVERKLYTEF